MMFNTLLVFGLFQLIFAQEKLLEPCAVRDLDCLTRSTEIFLGNTRRGIPDIDVRPIDPLTSIEPFSVEVDKDLGLVFHFKNLNITGLRNQKISDFQMDTSSKAVLLKTKADLDILADLRVEVQGKSFPGVYRAAASVLGTARYNYDLVDRNGEHYFSVGPETLSCEMNGEPTVQLNKELLDALAIDPMTRSRFSANKEDYRKQTVCKIAEKAYKIVVHNIRAVAKILPKTAFFKDM